MSTRIADKIACFAGDMRFFWLNLFCFLAWILWNTFAPWRFDPYPFQALTLYLSVEAIFLTIFVLIAQHQEDHAMKRKVDCDLCDNTNATTFTDRETGQKQHICSDCYASGHGPVERIV